MPVVLRPRLLIGFALLLSGILVSSMARAADADSGEKIYQRALKSTVWVLSPRGNDLYTTGTGSLIDQRRNLIITNLHVVGEAELVAVLFPASVKGKVIAERKFYRDLLENGAGLRGKVVARDAKKDLALIQLEGLPADAVALKLSKDSPGPGQRVHSIGNPGKSGALWVYTSGTVRQVYKKQWAVKDEDGTTNYDAQVVETQSPTNPGDSGGPLFNDKGELVGVTQGGTTNAQLVSLFIDISEVRTLLASKGLAKLPTPPAPAEKPKPVTTGETKPPVDDAEKAEQLAAGKLNLTKQLITDGKVDRARERLQEIIKTYPKTKAAAESEQILVKLKK